MRIEKVAFFPKSGQVEIDRMIFLYHGWYLYSGTSENGKSILEHRWQYWQQAGGNPDWGRYESDSESFPISDRLFDFLHQHNLLRHGKVQLYFAAEGGILADCIAYMIDDELQRLAIEERDAAERKKWTEEKLKRKEKRQEFWRKVKSFGERKGVST